MRSAFGPHRFDTAHRAVVVGGHAGTDWPDVVVVDPARPGERPVVEVVGSIVRSSDAPVVVRTADPAVLAGALEGGAAGGYDDSGTAGDEYLSVAAAAQATVMLGSPERPAPLDECLAVVRETTERARAHGLDPERMVVGVPHRLAARPGTADCRALVEGITAGGVTAMAPVCSSAADEGSAEAVAVQAALTLAGVRIFVTDDVRRSRRVTAVLAELLAARETGGRA